MKIYPLSIALAFTAISKHSLPVHTTLTLTCVLRGTVPDALAAPAKLIVITKWTPETVQPGVERFRLGHAAGLANPPSFEQDFGRMMIVPPQPKKHGCGGGAAARNAKLMEIQNKFRGMLGLPLIEPSNAVVHLKRPLPTEEPNDFHILPFGSKTPPFEPKRIIVHVNDPHRYEAVAMNKDFATRLQRSLSMLGPWEGRAVAFVLGCGLGVLIRMIWVFALLFIRSFRNSRREDDSIYVHDVIFVSSEEDAQSVNYPTEKVDGGKEGETEVVVVAPPAYEAPATTNV